MPVIITRAPLSASGFGALGSTRKYWIATLSSSRASAITVDTNNYIYVCGDNGNYVELVKYNTLGVIQWQVQLGTTGSGTGVAVDTSGNVYISGRNLTGANYSLLTAKYNSSGVLQWQRKLGSSLGQWTARSIAVDTSGNAYIGGYTTSGFVGQIAKYDTSGTIQWQRSLTGGSTIINSIAVDSSSNVYICGSSNNSGTFRYEIAKYNSSGSIQWQRALSSVTDAGNGIAVDSSGNVYVCGQSNNGVVYTFSLAKFNTAGTLQWSKSLDPSFSSTNSYFSSIAVDKFGNVGVCGLWTDLGANRYMQIAKYDNSGTLLWQRRMGASVDGTGVSFDTSGNVCVCGTAQFNKMFFAKLPADGRQTGTYIVGAFSVTYAASTQTDTLNPVSSSIVALTDASTAYTDAAGALISSTSTLTESFTRI